MTNYSYEGIKCDNLQAFMARVNRATGAVPTGASSGAVTEVSFENPLTVEQKAALDALMQSTTRSDPPSKVGSSFHIKSVLDVRGTLRGTIAVPFIVYQDETGTTIHFDSTLTVRQKADFIDALKNLVTEV